MATPGQLVAITANALRLPEVTVTLHHRAIRKAGLMHKSGRGRSAPQVSALDASRLLIALMGARIIREAPDAVRAIGRYRQVTSEVDRNVPFMPADMLPEGHAFEDALAKVLSDMAMLPVSRAMVGRHIGVTASVNLEDATADLSLPDGFLRYVGRPRHWMRRGLSETRTVYIDALIRVSRALSPPLPKKGVARGRGSRAKKRLKK